MPEVDGQLGGVKLEGLLEGQRVLRAEAKLCAELPGYSRDDEDQRASDGEDGPKPKGRGRGRGRGKGKGAGRQAGAAVKPSTKTKGRASANPKAKSKAKAKPARISASPCPGPGFVQEEDPEDPVQSCSPNLLGPPVKRRLQFAVELDPAHDSQKPLTPPAQKAVQEEGDAATKPAAKKSRKGGGTGQVDQQPKPRRKKGGVDKDAAQWYMQAIHSFHLKNSQLLYINLFYILVQRIRILYILYYIYIILLYIYVI